MKRYIITYGITGCALDPETIEAENLQSALAWAQSRFAVVNEDRDEPITLAYATELAADGTQLDDTTDSVMLD